MTDPDVSVSTIVARPPLEVWAAVADPRRVTRWSPEASRVSGAADGPLPVGARFDGANRHGVFRWTTAVVVVESTPGAAFAFDVTYLGLAVSRWRYSMAPDPAGSVVTEEWFDRRGRAMRLIGTVGTGVRDRRTHNEGTMRATLDALRTELERT